MHIFSYLISQFSSEILFQVPPFVLDHQEDPDQWMNIHPYLVADTGNWDQIDGLQWKQFTDNLLTCNSLYFPVILCNSSTIWLFNHPGNLGSHCQLNFISSLIFFMDRLPGFPLSDTPISGYQFASTQRRSIVLQWSNCIRKGRGRRLHRENEGIIPVFRCDYASLKGCRR